MPIDPILLGKLNVASATEGAEITPEDVAQLSQIYDDYDTRTAEYGDYKHRSMLERAFDQNDGMPGEFEYVQPILQARTRLAGGKLESEELDALSPEGEIFYVADGGQSRTATVDDLIAELRKSESGFAAHFADPNADENGQGGGQRPYGEDAWERLANHRRENGMRDSRQRANAR